MKNTNETNWYKVATFILVGVIVIFGIYYAISSYGNSKYESGVLDSQNQLVYYIVNSVAKNGFMTFALPEGNMTVVDSNALAYTQQQTIMTIMKEVDKNGYVVLYNNQTQLVLVPGKVNN
jgi:hypothetical protein